MKREPKLQMSWSRTVLDKATCEACGAVLPWRPRQEAWLEVPLEGGWMAAYRILVKGGRPVVAEARLFPDEKSRTAGSWSKVASSVPSGGIPGSALRSLRLADPIDYFPRIVANFKRRHGPDAVDQVFGRYGMKHTDRIVPRRPGRAGRSDEFLVRWAVAYIERVASGSRHPVKDLAEDPPVPIEGYLSTGGQVAESTARDILYQARKRGLLTPSPSGRAGGQLTTAGHEALGQIRRRQRRPGTTKG